MAMTTSGYVEAQAPKGNTMVFVEQLTPKTIADHVLDQRLRLARGAAYVFSFQEVPHLSKHPVFRMKAALSYLHDGTPLSSAVPLEPMLQGDAFNYAMLPFITHFNSVGTVRHCSGEMESEEREYRTAKYVDRIPTTLAAHGRKVDLDLFRATSFKDAIVKSFTVQNLLTPKKQHPKRDLYTVPHAPYDTGHLAKYIEDLFPKGEAVLLAVHGSSAEVYSDGTTDVDLSKTDVDVVFVYDENANVDRIFERAPLLRAYLAGRFGKEIDLKFMPRHLLESIGSSDPMIAIKGIAPLYIRDGSYVSIQYPRIQDLKSMTEYLMKIREWQPISSINAFPDKFASREDVLKGMFESAFKAEKRILEAKAVGEGRVVKIQTRPGISEHFQRLSQEGGRAALVWALAKERVRVHDLLYGQAVTETETRSTATESSLAAAQATL